MSVVAGSGEIGAARANQHYNGVLNYAGISSLVPGTAAYPRDALLRRPLDLGIRVSGDFSFALEPPEIYPNDQYNLILVPEGYVIAPECVFERRAIRTLHFLKWRTFIVCGH